MQHIETIELGSSQASITFSSIPQTYTDLVLLISARSTESATWYPASVIPNGGVFTDVDYIRLFGTGSSVGSNGDDFGPEIPGSTSTASTFSSVSVYISNYTATQAKSISVDNVTENNATAALQQIMAGLWNNTNAITSLEVDGYLTSQLDTGSTFSLYGITAGSDGTTTVS